MSAAAEMSLDSPDVTYVRRGSSFALERRASATAADAEATPAKSSVTEQATAPSPSSAARLL